MAEKRWEIAQVACEIEAVEGAAEVLIAADAFLAHNVRFDPDIQMFEPNPVKTHFGNGKGRPGRRSARLGFDIELVGTAAAGDAVHFSDALRACGFGQTLVPATSATYLPATNAIPSVTLAIYADGMAYKIWGARAATAKLTAEVGKPWILSVDYLGADFSILDANLLVGVSLSTVDPPVFQGATFTLDAYSANFSKLEIDLGLKTKLRTAPTGTGGHLSAAIVGRYPTLSLNPEACLVATKDFFGQWRAGTEVALATAWGSVAGNTHAVSAPKVQYTGVKPQDEEGIEVFMISAKLNPNAGDDELQWQIT